MRTRRIPSALLLTALAAVGCGDGNETSSTGDTTTSTPEKPAAVIDIAVDASRDGKVDPSDPADQDLENEWTVDSGASFLANMDDDDADKIRDVDDQIINGPDDELDLAKIVVSPWADAPDGANGVLRIDPLSAENVRLWKKGLDGVWILAGGSVGPCNADDPTCTITPDVPLTIDEVRAGITFGIEAKFFRRSLAPEAWSGIVQLGYQVLDANNVAFTSDDAPNGIDEAKIRVAPWMLFGNQSPFNRVWSNNVMPAFVTGLTQLSNDAEVTYKKITNWNDHWTQDYFQTGWTTIPAADGAVQGMRIANARPWGRCDASTCWPINWLKKGFLSPGNGIIEIYNKPNTGGTYDSHGNHDLIPPYENGDVKYPYGRIIIGSGVLKETKEFYTAQEVQGPPLIVKTSWLLVGHVDEVFSYVPAATPRGWKLLVGSPRLAREMLEAAQDAGHGAVTMFGGKKWYTENGSLINAEVSIDDVLGNVDLMAASQEAQSEIDLLIPLMKEEIGLTDDEIIEMPYLLQDAFGQKVAFNPGTANLLAVHDHVGIPKPWGPVIDGVDIFEQDLDDRLGTAANKLGYDGEGLDIHFIDDWDWYHALDGEVHCGSNVDADPPADQTWWKVLK
ncbi:MAG: protein-arginine deiminase family protein [Polyangiaceae bacterium]